MAMLNNQMVVWYKHVSAIWIHGLESLNIGGLNPEKYEFASWDHEIPNWMGGQIHSCSKPPTRISLLLFH